MHVYTYHYVIMTLSFDVTQKDDGGRRKRRIEELCRLEKTRSADTNLLAFVTWDVEVRWGSFVPAEQHATGHVTLRSEDHVAVQKAAYSLATAFKKFKTLTVRYT